MVSLWGSSFHPEQANLVQIKGDQVSENFCFCTICRLAVGCLNNNVIVKLTIMLNWIILVQIVLYEGSCHDNFLNKHLLVIRNVYHCVLSRGFAFLMLVVIISGLMLRKKKPFYTVNFGKRSFLSSGCFKMQGKLEVYSLALNFFWQYALQQLFNLSRSLFYLNILHYSFCHLISLKTTDFHNILYNCW